MTHRILREIGRDIEQATPAFPLRKGALADKVLLRVRRHLRRCPCGDIVSADASPVSLETADTFGEIAREAGQRGVMWTLDMSV